MQTDEETEAVAVLEVWNELAYLVREPGRRGRSVWWVRLAFGELVPKRYGPFATEQEGRVAFSAIIDAVESGLGDMFCEAGNEAGVQPIEEL